MASSSREEIVPLIESEQAAPVAVGSPAAAHMEGVVRTRTYVERVRRIVEVPPAAPFPWWRRLPFLRPSLKSISVGQPLSPEQMEMLNK